MLKWMVKNMLRRITVDAEYQHPNVEIIAKFENDVIFSRTINLHRENK